MKTTYPYIVKPVSKETHGVNFVVEFMDIKGISGGGDTEAEAILIAKEALDMYMEVLVQENKPLPKATSFEENGRVTLRLPKSLHLLAIEKADHEGVSLNTFILDAVAKKVYTHQAYDEIYSKMSKNNKTYSLELNEEKHFYKKKEK